jgi:hypothetical protein
MRANNLKIIRNELEAFLERQESIIPWKKNRSPSPVEEKSEHSSDKGEDKPVGLMGAVDHSSREGSFDRDKNPVNLITARTVDTKISSSAHAEAHSSVKLELLN